MAVHREFRTPTEWRTHRSYLAAVRRTKEIEIKFRELVNLALFQLSVHVELALRVAPGSARGSLAGDLGWDIRMSLGLMKRFEPAILLPPFNELFSARSFWNLPNEIDFVKLVNEFFFERSSMTFLSLVGDPPSKIVRSFFFANKQMSMVSFIVLELLNALFERKLGHDLKMLASQ